jgi:hypothetical protein
MSGYVPKRDAPVGDSRGSFPGKAGIDHPSLIAISRVHALVTPRDAIVAPKHCCSKARQCGFDAVPVSTGRADIPLGKAMVIKVLSEKCSFVPWVTYFNKSVGFIVFKNRRRI